MRASSDSPSGAGASSPTRLRDVFVALGFLAATVLVAAALAGPVDRLLRDWGWVHVGPGEDTTQFLKVFRRLLLLPLVAGFLLWVRPWRDGNLASYGLQFRWALVRSGVRAWGVTVLVAVGLLALHFLLGWLSWEEPLRWGKGWGRVVRWIPNGVFIAALEEWFFRGWLLRRAARRWEVPLAVLITSLAFAFLHVFNVRRVDADVTHDVSGALEALGQWLGLLLEPARVAPDLVGLFLFGLVLSAAYLRTRTLWTPIGIHAGGIFVLRAYGGFTDRFPNLTWAGGKWLYDGPVGWAVLLLAFVLLWPWGRDEDALPRADAAA